MTIRIKPNLNDTAEILGMILREVNADKRVMFVCDAGDGVKIMQRVRVKLSRVRNSLRNRGQRRKHFILHHSIHPHTEGGKRHDAVVVWRSQTQVNKMTETLEDLVGTGDQL